MKPTTFMQMYALPLAVQQDLTLTAKWHVVHSWNVCFVLTSRVLFQIAALYILWKWTPRIRWYLWQLCYVHNGISVINRRTEELFSFKIWAVFKLKKMDSISWKIIFTWLESEMNEKREHLNSRFEFHREPLGVPSEDQAKITLTYWITVIYCGETIV